MAEGLSDSSWVPSKQWAVELMSEQCIQEDWPLGRICRKHMGLCCINTPEFLTAWCSLLWDCPTHVGCLAASTREMPVAPYPQLWQLKMSPDSAKCPLGNRRAPGWEAVNYTDIMKRFHQKYSINEPPQQRGLSTCNLLRGLLHHWQGTESISPFTDPTNEPHRITAGCFKLGVLVHSCNPRARKADTGGPLQVQGPSDLYMELSSRLARATPQNLSQKNKPDTKAALWWLRTMW